MKFSIILVICFLWFESYSQYSVEGRVSDSLSKAPIKDALITIINAQDSILIAYGRSNENGFFKITDSEFAKSSLIHVLISYPEYVSGSYTVSVSKEGGSIFREVKLLTRQYLLDEVIVKNRLSAIRIIKDTIEFKADSFWVAKNADVNSLFKQLPGLQINEDGTIYAYGEKVQKVLVDGEEYFSRDPVLVSKMIRADMVDKVQLYDKKSDQAQLTGIDDGKKEKVINLKIKEEKKRAVFGKTSVATGNKDTYNGELMINRFNDRAKTALFGILSAVGKVGLSSKEEDSFGNEDANSFSVIQNVQELDGWNGRFENNGLPIITTLGIHNNDRSKENTTSYNTDARYYDLRINGLRTINSEYLLPSGRKLLNKDSFYFSNKIIKSKVFGVVDFTIDSLSSLKVTIHGSNLKKASNYLNIGEQRDGNNTVVNSFINKRSFNTEGFEITPSLAYKHRFKKTGRGLYINTRLDIIDNKAKGFIYTKTSINNTQSPADTIDQFKDYVTRSQYFTSSISILEPISKGQGILSLNYQLVYSNNNLIRNSFNKSSDLKYSILDSIFSNEFKVKVLVNKLGGGINLKKKNYFFNSGLDVDFANFQQQSSYRKDILDRRFINWYPKATISISLGKLRSISFSYSGETKQPSFDQLQPLRNNIEPLFVIQGNEKLLPSFVNTFQFTYLNRKPIEFKNMWATFTLTKIQNGFSTNDSIDASGRKYIKTINIDGIQNVNLYAQYDFRTQVKKVNFSTGINLGRAISANIVNSVYNNTSNKFLTLTGIMRKSVSRKYELMLRYSIGFNQAISSLQNDESFFYVTNTFRASYDKYFTNQIVFHTDFSANVLTRTGFFGNSVNLYIWNASFAKKFLKDESISLQLSLNDILNTNKGIVRTANTYVASEQRSSVLTRYGLLTFMWNFNRSLK